MNNPELFFTRQRESDLSFRLLNSPHYAFIMSFFSHAFKEPKVRVKDKATLKDELTSYIAEQKSKNPCPFDIPTLSAEYLINTWCDDNHQWLLHTSEDKYELTAYTNRLFEYAESTSQAFNTYKTEDIWKNVVDKTAELAAEMATDATTRIAYHNNKIKELEAEIQKQKDIIATITKTGKVTLKPTTEMMQMMDYIRQLLTSFQGEVDRYKLKTLKMIDEFHYRASDISKSHDDDGQIIEALIASIRKFKTDKAYICVDKLSHLATNQQLKERLEVLNETIRAGFAQFGLPPAVDIMTEMDLATIEIAEINSHYGMVSVRIIEILNHNNSVERRYLDKLLRQIEIDGAYVKNAQEKVTDESKQMYLYTGGMKLFNPLSLLLIGGRNLTFKKKNVTKEVTFAQVTAQVTNMDKVEKPKRPDDIDFKVIRKNIESCQRKYHRVTLGLLAKEFPMTKGLREISAYTTELVKHNGTVSPKEWEEFKVRSMVVNENNMVEKIKNYTVFTAKLEEMEGE